MHRRTWLQTTALHYTGFTTEIDSRQTVTLGFAADPTPAYAQQMLDDGVDWFVVDRSTSNRTTWEPYATIKYTNDSFFALRLNKNN
jgi:coproporphyrinogen III oxidase